MSNTTNNSKPKDFHIGIKAVIVKNKKVLLLKDPDRFAGFDLPGGKIDEGEAIEKALKRELFEELGVKEFKIGKLLHVFERMDYSKKDRGLMLIFYKVEAKLSKIQLSHEHTEYKYLSKKEFLKFIKNGQIRNEGVKEAIAKVLK